MLISTLKRIPSLYEFLRYRIYAPLQSKNRKRVFLKIYQENAWGDRSSVSGPGSSLEATAELRRTLPGLLAELGVKSLLDIPCGDLEWIKHVPLRIEKYIGADIVEPLIEKNRIQYPDFGEFRHLDLLTDPLPSVDAILCRDCFIHLSNRDVIKALANIARTDAQYLITTTFPDLTANQDTVTPYWRALNLQLAPYNLPPPLRIVGDFSPLQAAHEQKYQGVWRIGDLREILSISNMKSPIG